MTTRPTALTLALTATLTLPALAGGLPPYTYQLLALEGRPTLPAVGIPADADLVGADAAIDELGNAAARWTANGGDADGIFVFTAATSSSTNILFGTGDYSGTIDLYAGRLGVSQTFGTSQAFTTTLDGTPLSTFAVGGPAGITGSFSRPRLTSTGKLAFRASAGSTSKLLLEWFEGATRRSATFAETGPVYSFLAGGAVNDSEQYAARVNLTAGGAAIVRWSLDAAGASTAQDVETFTATNLTANFADMNNAGQVTYFRRASTSAPWQLVRRVPGQDATIIATGDEPLPSGLTLANNEFANFAPVISATGLVAFNPRRIGSGTSTTLSESIWVGDGTTLTSIVQAGQVLATTTGDFILTSGDCISGNSIAINGQGQVAFIARLLDGRDALFVATPRVTACGSSDVAGPGQAVGANGSLTADDIIVFIGWFFAADARADIAGPGQTPEPDGAFTADDIILFINRFFAGC
jgi:hypothetical protein